MTRIVALTGGIGSGKSTVAALLEKLGAVVIDADAITRELQARGSPLLAEIEQAFGPEVIDARGELDRDAMAARVFRDAAERARLEALVHPRVGAEMARRIQAAQRADARLVILDVPLLYEARRAKGVPTPSRADPFDSVIVVYAPESAQIERQLRRNSYDRDEAGRRVRAQLPIDEKRRLADHVIDNSGSLQETERQVRQLFERLVAEPQLRGPARSDAPRSDS